MCDHFIIQWELIQRPFPSPHHQMTHTGRIRCQANEKCYFIIQSNCSSIKRPLCWMGYVGDYAIKHVGLTIGLAECPCAKAFLELSCAWQIILNWALQMVRVPQTHFSKPLTQESPSPNSPSDRSWTWMWEERPRPPTGMWWRLYLSAVMAQN